ncbi:MAG: uracil-DNA glycosylase [Deltaproteobacteria bacterium]|nr:uracil-DNA glycosylase [Deltaproteobacteria bacterium]
MDEVKQGLIKDIKNYFLYLKEIGVEELPVQGSGGERHGRAFDGQGSEEIQNSTPDSIRGKIQNLEDPPKKRSQVSSHKPQLLTLKAIREELGDCKRCKLYKGRTHIVFGVGNGKAPLVFVGEGPGRDEDLQGEPFVGRAGQLLTRIIEAIGFRRPDVYICNVVKCRPPENRNPEPDEIAACRPFLEKQLEVIKPKIIVALGNISAQTLLNTTSGITELRGKFYWYREDIKVMPTFHPSYLLRNESKKKEVWEDMKMVMAGLKESKGQSSKIKMTD